MKERRLCQGEGNGFVHADSLVGRLRTGCSQVRMDRNYIRIAKLKGADPLPSVEETLK